MFLAVASCFAAGCSVNESLENETVTVPAAKILGTPGEDAVKGSILVYLDDDMLARMSSGSVTKGAESDPDFSEIFPGVGIDGARKVFRSIDENNMDKADMSLRHWYKLYFDEGLSLTEVAESLAGLEGVQRVQYNVRIHSDVEPVVYVGASAAGSISSHAAALGQDPLFNDPNLPLQWHYSNDGTVCRAAVAGADINVMDAWRLTAGDRDIIVADVDRLAFQLTRVEGERNDGTDRRERGRGEGDCTDAQQSGDECHKSFHRGIVACHHRRARCGKKDSALSGKHIHRKIGP